ncbi:hypothetical protein ACOSQ4_013561 [Xanthoceras sorbifolium]
MITVLTEWRLDRRPGWTKSVTAMTKRFRLSWHMQKIRRRIGSVKEKRNQSHANKEMATKGSSLVSKDCGATAMLGTVGRKGLCSVKSSWACGTAKDSLQQVLGKHGKCTASLDGWNKEEKNVVSSVGSTSQGDGDSE